MKISIHGKKKLWIFLSIIAIILLVEFTFLSTFIASRRSLAFFLLEAIVILCVGATTKSILAMVLLVVPIGVEAAQYASIYSTGNYIIPLTLLNLGNVHVIGNQLFVVSTIIILYIILFYINIFLMKKIHALSWKKKAFLPSCCIFALCLSCSSFIQAKSREKNIHSPWKILYIFPTKP